MDVSGDKNITPLHGFLQKVSYETLELLKKQFKLNGDDMYLTDKEVIQAFKNSLPRPFFTTEEHAIIKFVDEIRSKNCKTKICWSDILNFLIENLEPQTNSPVCITINKTLEVPHVKREAIVKVVEIETEKYFCYCMISKYGRVGLYDGNLNFLTTYHLIMSREDITRSEEDRRKRNRWITDAIFCSDALMLIISNNSRSLTIYDVTGLKHIPLWLILSTPNVVECLAYKPCKQGSILFMGDDNGMLSSFVFLKPTTGFMRKKYNDKINVFYWSELPNEKNFIIYNKLGQFVQHAIEKLLYIAEDNMILFCSADPKFSLCVKYMGLKKETHIFKIPRGCRAFALSRKLKLLLTGGDDCMLRLWNPLITRTKVAALRGHIAPITDVQFIENHKVFLSCSRDGVLKIWHAKDEICLQTLDINFPCFKVFGKLIEWGIQSIYPGPKRIIPSDVWERSPILVVCCNYIACIKVTFRDKILEENLDAQILVPPPLQNSVLIPKMWRTEDGSESLKNINVESSKGLGAASGDEDSACVTRNNHLEKYDFIFNWEFSKLNDDINQKISGVEISKLGMMENVAKGAPYLALQLQDVQDFRLTAELPRPKNERVKALVEQTEKILDDASMRDVIFSESLSTHSLRSSRSSTAGFD